MTTIQRENLTDDQFIAKYEKLIHDISYRYYMSTGSVRYVAGVELDDMYQIGVLGLLAARDRFNPENGAKFSTYAHPFIKGYIQNYLRDNRLVHIPRTLHALVMATLRANLQEAQPEEVAKALGITVSKAQEVLNQFQSYMYSDAHLDTGEEPDGGTIELSLTLSEESFEKDSDNREVLEGFLSTLTSKEKGIWFTYHNKGRTQREVAKEFGVDQMTVSRVLKKIENKAELYGKKHGLNQR